MNMQFLIGRIVFIVLLIGLSGCIEDDSSSDQSNEVIVSSATESVDSLLEKADLIDSMYYEIVTTVDMTDFGTQNAFIKIWQKKPYLKAEITSEMNEISNTILVIQRPEGLYSYDKSKEKFILTKEIPSFITSLDFLDNDMIKSFINNQSLSDFETVKLNGKKTTLIQYSPSIEFSKYQMTVKIWIWNEKGVPLKAFIDMQMEETSIVMNLDFNNYSFTNIPDSIFDI